jgi:hypothetical protein
MASENLSEKSPPANQLPAGLSFHSEIEEFETHLQASNVPARSEQLSRLEVENVRLKTMLKACVQKLKNVMKASDAKLEAEKSWSGFIAKLEPQKADHVAQTETERNKTMDTLNSWMEIFKKNNALFEEQLKVKDKQLQAMGNHLEAQLEVMGKQIEVKDKQLEAQERKLESEKRRFQTNEMEIRRLEIQVGVLSGFLKAFKGASLAEILEVDKSSKTATEH